MSRIEKQLYSEPSKWDWFKIQSDSNVMKPVTSLNLQKLYTNRN
jgi:hypothetical protein